ncbi:MAG: hypothetical protein K6C40_15675 [Thermoguttaceae bacterium]|nr:hypothetical protein [Thermoguttaceae bacterium]
MLKNFPKLLILCSVLLLGAGVLPGTFFSQTVQAQYIQLSADQMKAALRCPTDESKEFVDDVFTLVARGIVPESLVISSFNYAYKQPKQNQSWYYFQRSLDLRCDKLGINLDREMSKLHKKEK